MKGRIVVFVLAGSLMAFGQGHGHGMSDSMGQGMGDSMGSGTSGDMGRGHGMGAPSEANAGNGGARQGSEMQQPLKDAQVNGGAFRMLERKTGMTADQLQALYKSSAAKNFGQFVSAIVVSKNLNLDTQKVLDGLKTQSLGQTLQSMGVAQNTAKEEIRKAHQEIKDAGSES
jgi:hypothetical protein